MNRNFLIKTLLVSFVLNLLFGLYPFWSVLNRNYCDNAVELCLSPEIYGGWMLQKNLLILKTTEFGLYLQRGLGWVIWWIVVVVFWKLTVLVKKKTSKGL